MTHLCSTSSFLAFLFTWIHDWRFLKLLEEGSKCRCCYGDDVIILTAFFLDWPWALRIFSSLCCHERRKNTMKKKIKKESTSWKSYIYSSWSDQLSSFLWIDWLLQSFAPSHPHHYVCTCDLNAFSSSVNFCLYIFLKSSVLLYICTYKNQQIQNILTIVASVVEEFLVI